MSTVGRSGLIFETMSAFARSRGTPAAVRARYWSRKVSVAINGRPSELFGRSGYGEADTTITSGANGRGVGLLRLRACPDRVPTGRQNRTTRGGDQHGTKSREQV